MEKFYVNEGGKVCGHNGALDECETAMLLTEREQLMAAAWDAMQDRAMSLPDLAFKFDEQAQRITTLEAEKAELRRLSKVYRDEVLQWMRELQQVRKIADRAEESMGSTIDQLECLPDVAGWLDGGEES